MADTATGDPRELSLDELRAERNRLQDDDDRVSYVRRAAQSRLDLVRAVRERRNGGAADGTSVDDLSGELRRVLSQHLTAGSGPTTARPPRDGRDDIADGPLVDELDRVCAEGGFSRLSSSTAPLDDDELAALEAALADFERRVSDDRRARFDRIDALGSELVRRYREGEADVDSLLGD